MLTAIPLSLIGIVLGHWMLGAYFTATSMVGFIALAGVMVRNSVLLIDFIDIRIKEGCPLKQAIIEAGAVRTTPILLTAGAVVIGTVIILFDPGFQGLAISHGRNNHFDILNVTCSTAALFQAAKEKGLQ